MTKSQLEAFSDGAHVEIPASVKLIAWMYLVSAPVGFVAGVWDFIASAMAGNWTIPIPVGVGVSAWAIGKGLLSGNHRAWSWAKGFAGFGGVLIALMTVITLAFPGKSKFSILGTTHIVQVWDPVVLLWGGGMTLLLGWQFIVLRRSEVRELFQKEPTLISSQGEGGNEKPNS